MAQLYNHPFKQHLRLLLLQCVLLLGITLQAKAQTPTEPVLTYEGPWASGLPAGWSSSNLSADGADLSLSSGGGSAQFKSITSSLVAKLSNALTSEANLSFSLKPATTQTTYSTAIEVAASPDGITYNFIASVTTDQSKSGETRYTFVLPNGTQYVRYKMTERTNANLLLDAIKVSVAPEIYSFTPTEGGFDTSVTITGNGFGADLATTEVFFGGVKGTVTSVSNTDVVAKVPAGAKSGKITVVTATGTSDSYTDFTVYKPIITTKFTPITGKANETVTINGQYFAGATEVKFGGVLGAIVANSVSDTQLKAIIPLGAKTGNISITTPAGTGTSVGIFTVPAPTFATTTEFSPAAQGPGMAVTLYGSGLSSVDKIIFLGIENDASDDVEVAIPAPNASDTELAVTVPANAKTGKLKMSSPNGSATSAGTFTFIPAPVITGFSPASGLATVGSTSGTSVTITGENFENVSKVTFAGATDRIAVTTGITTNTDGSLTVIVPENAVTGKISLTTPGGTATSAKDFIVVTQSPVISGFTPTSARAGDEVTITGTNFEGLNQVKLGDAEAQIKEGSNTSTSVVVIVPAVPADLTNRLVYVENPAGPDDSGDLMEPNFTWITSPLISEFSPKKGVATVGTTAGTSVTITGKLLSDVTSVTFTGPTDRITATSVTKNIDGSLTVTVPEGAITGVIIVTNSKDESDATGTVEAPENFEVYQKPVISGFSPVSGYQGDEITITGSNFSGISRVTIGGVEANIKEGSATSTTVVAFVPAALSGVTEGLVAVENPAGADDSGDLTTSKFTWETTPLVLDFTPKEGPIGQEITITGKLLKQITEVNIGGVSATLPASDTRTEDKIIVNVPPGAAPGSAVITLNYVEGANTTSITTQEQFTVIVVPSNITFSPTSSGTVGSFVDVKGDYLDGATKVTFSNEKSVALTATDFGTDPADGKTVIYVQVPAGAVDGSVTVSNQAGTSDPSAEPFNILEPSVKIVGLTGNEAIKEGYAGQSVTIKGNFFSGATEVKFNGVAVASSNFTFLSENEIRVPAPFNAGEGVVSVTTPSGTSTSTVKFKVYKPVINNFDPKVVYAGETVTVTGSYLLYDHTDAAKKPTIRFGTKGVAADDITSWSDTEIKFKAPFDGGTGSLSITTKSGIQAMAGAEVVEPKNITFSPAQAFEKQEVVISGLNLMQDTRNTASVPTVKFNGVVAEVKLDPTPSNTQLTAIVPLGASTGPITVETASGIGQSASFYVIKDPNVLSFTPGKGVRSKTEVTVTGEDFFEVKSVKLGTVEILPAAYTISSDGKTIKFTVPADANTGKISVTNTKSTQQSSTDFRVVLPPTVSTYANTNPGSYGPQAGKYGSTVKITGTSLLLEDIVSVTFNGTTGSLSSMTSNAEGTELTVVVPTGATDGDLVVTNLAGSVTAGPFVITNPTITNITNLTTPTRASYTTRRGEKLLIQGTKLRDVGSIKFNGGTTSQFFSIDDENLEVIVPNTAITGLVTVYTLEGEAVSPQNLEVIVPVITTSTTSLPRFAATVGGESAPQSYTVSATNLESDITVTAPRGGNFLISLEGTTGYAGSLSIARLGNENIGPVTIYVKYVPTTEDYHSGNITHTATNATMKTVFVEGTSTITPLPVELMSFKATVQGSKALLTWVTASEQDNSHFEIETSLNAADSFEKVGRVDSKTTNSSIRNSYEFTHSMGNANGTRYYRLKQVDLNGTSSYSKVVAVTVKAQELVQQLLVAPNPINYNSKVFITAVVAGKATFTLHNMTGKKVYTKEAELQEGENEVQLPVYDQLPNGLYILTVELNGQQRQVKVVKQ